MYEPSMGMILYTSDVRMQQKSGVFKQISEWDISVLTTVSIARCSTEIMKATAIPKFTSLATILRILQLREHRQSQTQEHWPSRQTS